MLMELCVMLFLALCNLVVTYNPGSNFQTSKVIASISKRDGTITIWGNPYRGGIGVTTVGDIKSISSNNYAFAAVKTDGRYVLLTLLDAFTGLKTSSQPSSSSLSFSSQHFFAVWLYGVTFPVEEYLPHAA